MWLFLLLTLKKIDRLIFEHLHLKEERLEDKFATKSELHEELKRFASTVELQEVKVELKVDIEELKENISYLPTKNEFYDRMDKIMGELKAVREEQTFISQHLADHTDEISNIKATLQPFSS